jgi:ergothioneine biosynthesis protein EgtB
MQMPTTEKTTMLLDRFRAIRTVSRQITEPLVTEDFVVQSMPDVSPTRWHLAHTTWFFETFLLKPRVPDYRVFHPEFEYLFNSYYNAVGDQFPRPCRGLLSRPTVSEIEDYRGYVDQHVEQWLVERQTDPGDAADIIELGLQHEQQHQELILTDIKHVFFCNPLKPIYSECPAAGGVTRPMQWASFEEGLRDVGHDGRGFAYDNEGPRHRVFLRGFELASRLVTSGEYMAFIQDGGYRRPELWLSDGWALIQAEGWTAPLYWQEQNGKWSVFTLSGERPVHAAEPVCHVSYFEADAYARWAGARLATEAEWEVAAGAEPIDGNCLETGAYHPRALAAEKRSGLHQLFGDAWEWTASPYVSYPGYRPTEGALGEYNAKFMCNQQVLRGGSCVTALSHVRPTYRNFFGPAARWQFSGIRLAR